MKSLVVCWFVTLCDLYKCFIAQNKRRQQTDKCEHLKELKKMICNDGGPNVYIIFIDATWWPNCYNTHKTFNQQRGVRFYLCNKEKMGKLVETYKERLLIRVK